MKGTRKNLTNEQKAEIDMKIKMSKQQEEAIDKQVSKIKKSYFSPLSTDEAKSSASKQQISKTLKPSSGSLGSWTKEEGAITPSSLPQNFDALSATEQICFIHKQEQIARRGKEFDKTFVHPRLMSEQQTKPVQLDFWSSTEIANTNVLARAKVLQTDGKLLNAFSFGIDGDVLTLKVIQTLQEKVSETSELYGKNGTQLSGSNTLLPNAKRSTKVFADIPKDTIFPSITTTPYEFAKAVLGGRKPNKKDITAIRNELDRLDSGKFLFQDSKTKRGAIMSLLDVTDLIEGKKAILYIELKPVFAQIAGQLYVRERKDVARYLRRKVRKAMTMILYQELMIAFSKGDVGQQRQYYTLKGNLFARIAKGSTYERHPKRILEHYQQSLEVMKGIGLLQNYREKELNGTVCYFTLNKDFLKQDRDFDKE